MRESGHVFAANTRPSLGRFPTMGGWGVEIGASVLIADEDQRSRAQLARLLRSAGYAVLEAARGDEALAIARSAHPAAVITEIPLAGLCGYEICHALKIRAGSPASRAVPDERADRAV
jgi:CheY-like chemotaxis protein